MIRFLRPAFTGITVASVLATAACASGPQPTPTIATLQPYNGEWVLEAADRGPTRLQFASTDGNGIASATSQRVVAIMVTRAEQFVLEVNASVFRVSSDEPAFSFSLPVDGTPVEVLGEDGEVTQSIGLSWSEGTPVVRRTLPGVGWVSDRYELTADGALIITRTAGMRNVRGAEVESSRPVEFVYVPVVN